MLSSPDFDLPMLVRLPSIPQTQASGASAALIQRRKSTIATLLRATPRADLDTRLEKIPEERDRLIDARIMRLAQESLAEAMMIVNPGSRLTSQIARAQETITYASTPVSVTMTSDGLTDVTLLRVKRLGTLAEQTLSLRPGLYTAVGIRNGYRDVRVKFEVRPNQRNAVEVRCVEPI